MTTLQWASAQSIKLTDAITAAALPGTPTGLVSTTAWYGFVRVEGTTLRRADADADVYPETVFDARVFTAGPVELRWVHENNGLGRAVLLAEDETRLRRARPVFRGPTAKTVHKKAVHKVVEQTMLLWGTSASGPDNGWITLREHRVGTLRVAGLPAQPSTRHRVVLDLREYVSEDKYGNAFVLDDLLCGLSWLDELSWRDAHEKETA
jgi:CRISPR-associated protein (TIGR03984 family)